MNNSGSGVSGNPFGTAAGFSGRLKHLASRLLRFFRATRCQPLLLITAACLLLREQYPLSNFPMYSSFGAHTFYIYLADGTGRPIASLPAVGMSTATMKKVYVTEMRKERDRLGLRAKKLTVEEKRPVGERLLTKLKNSPAVRQRGSAFPGGLRLYEVEIAMRERRFEKETSLVAEVR